MIIVLCGVRGSGKDTIGDLLVKNHEFRRYAFATPLKKMVLHAFPRFEFDDLYGPSKNREKQYEQYPFSGICVGCGIVCQEIMDTHKDGDGIRAEHNGWTCVSCGMSYPQFINPRIALQTLGTEWGRRLYQNVWIDAAFNEMKEVNSFDDVQGYHLGTAPQDLPPPRNWVITDGRFKNEVRRSRELGGITVLLTRGLKESTDPHPSEAELRTIDHKEFDFIFDNANYTLEQLPSALKLMLKELGRVGV